MVQLLNKKGRLQTSVPLSVLFGTFFVLIVILLNFFIFREKPANLKSLVDGVLSAIPSDNTEIVDKNLKEFIADYGRGNDGLLHLKKKSAESGNDSKITRKKLSEDIDETRIKSSRRALLSVNRTHCECGPVHTDPANVQAKDVLREMDPTTGRSGRDSLARYHPNLPLQLLDGAQRCRLLPDLFSISWTAVHWQEVRASRSETYYLYSAFYDNRTKTVPSGGAVRILALLDGNDPTPHWCQLWYDDQTQPVPTEVLRTEFFDYQNRSDTRLQPVLLTCAAGPQQGAGTVIPGAVSLVSRPCDMAKNVLKVIGKPSREVPHLQEEPQYQNLASPHWRVAVCGPGLFFLYDDYSLRLVEWLEMTKTLGVSQVFFYTTRGLHPNIEKVLRHYEETGYVELVDFRYPPPYMDEPVLRRTWTLVERSRMFAMEAITFTDCVLRYKDRYRFLAHFDPDEVPVLLKHDSLPQLLASLYSRETNSNQPPALTLIWKHFPLTVVAPQEEIAHGTQHMARTDQLIMTTFPNDFRPNPTQVKTLDAAVSNLPTPNSSRPNPTKVKTLDAAISNLPTYLTILRNTRRLKNGESQPKNNVKPIFDTLDATAVSSHKSSYCASGICQMDYTVPPNTAYLGHFRYPCTADDCKTYANITEEVPQVSKYRQTVIENIRLVLEELNMLP